jgi:ribosomal protein L11 methyltransferase
VPVVQVVVDAAEAELAADALWQAGPSAVGEEQRADGMVVLTADVADPAAVVGPWTVTLLAVDEDADLDAWRPWARPLRAGAHVVLHPAWLPVGTADADDVVVRLDPGRTFGSGSHASTRLVVAALEAHLGSGDRVLDVGTGSGVLAVVAARLGAGSVRGIDIDPASPAATRANAGANGVEAIVTASTEPLETVEGRFAVVVANIGVRVLDELAGALWARVESGGVLVLAGLLDAQVDPLLARAYPEAVEVDRRSLDGWSAVVLRRRAASG